MELSDDDEGEKKDPFKHINFQTKLNNIFSKLKFNAYLKHLITATFYSWDSLDSFHVEIPESSKQELRVVFEEFKLKRGALVENLSQIGIETEKLQGSNFFYHWFQGAESFEHFLSSEETQEWFTESEIANIRLNVLDWNDEKATSATSVELTESDLEQGLKNEISEELKPDFSEMQSRPSSSLKQASSSNISIASSQNQQNDLNQVPENKEKTETSNLANEGRSCIEHKSVTSEAQEIEKIELNQKQPKKRQEAAEKDEAKSQSEKSYLNIVNRANEDDENMSGETQHNYLHARNDKNESQTDASTSEGQKLEKREALASKSSVTISSDQSDATNLGNSAKNTAADEGASFTEPKLSKSVGHDFEKTEINQKQTASHQETTTSNEAENMSKKYELDSVSRTKEYDKNLKSAADQGLHFEKPETHASKSLLSMSSEQSDATNLGNSAKNTAADEGASFTEPKLSKSVGHDFEKTEINQKQTASHQETTTSNEAENMSKKYELDSVSRTKEYDKNLKSAADQGLHFEKPEAHASKSLLSMSSEQSDATNLGNSAKNTAADEGASFTEPKLSKSVGHDFEKTEINQKQTASHQETTTSNEAENMSKKYELDSVSRTKEYDKNLKSAADQGLHFEKPEAHASKSLLSMSSEQSDATNLGNSAKNTAADEGASFTEPKLSKSVGHDFEKTEINQKQTASHQETTTSNEAENMSKKYELDSVSRTKEYDKNLKSAADQGLHFEKPETHASKSLLSMSSEQSDATNLGNSAKNTAADEGASFTEPKLSKSVGHDFEKTEINQKQTASHQETTTSNEAENMSKKYELDSVSRTKEYDKNLKSAADQGLHFEKPEAHASKSLLSMSSEQSDATNLGNSAKNTAADEGASFTEPKLSKSVGHDFEKTEINQKQTASHQETTTSNEAENMSKKYELDSVSRTKEYDKSLKSAADQGLHFEKPEAHASKSLLSMSSEQSDATNSTSSEKSFKSESHDFEKTKPNQTQTTNSDTSAQGYLFAENEIQTEATVSSSSFETKEPRPAVSKISATPNKPHNPKNPDSSPALHQGTNIKHNQNRTAARARQTVSGGAKVVPLILCSETMQDGSKVYKFDIHETGFQHLIHLGRPGFEASSKPDKYEDIDLEQLNKVSLRLVGIIGPFQAVLTIFETRFNPEILKYVELIKSFDQSGLFLVEIEDEENLFIVFYSKNDEDFGPVKKESKIVHFLRYLSELTSQVIFCPIETDVDIFPKKSSLVGTKLKRMRMFTSHDTSQEAAAYQLTELGHFAGPLPDTANVFASNSAFCIISQRLKPPASKTEPKRETKKISQMKDFLEHRQIDQTTDIDAHFKMDFIKTFHSHTWEQIQQSVDEDIKDDTSLTNKCSRNLMLQAIALYFIRDEFSLEYKLIEGFYSDKQNGHYDLWEMHSSDKKLEDAIEKTQMVELKSKISNSTNPTKHSIKKQLLICVLEAQQYKLMRIFFRNSKLSQLSWEDLRTEAKKVFKSDNEAIDLLIAEEAEKISKSANSSWMKDKLPQFVAYISKKIEKLSSAKQTKQIFVAYLKEVHLKRIENLQTKMTIDYTNSSFSNMIERKKESVEKITRIISTENKAGEYEIFSEENVLVPPQKEIKISFPRLDSATEAGILEGNGTVLQNIQFDEIDTLVLEENESLVSAHPTQTKSVVICLNKHQPFEETLEQKTQYLAEVFVVPEKIEIISIRHNISTNTFDCQQRKLALSCQDNPNIIYLITFEPSFRKKNQTSQIDLEKFIGNVSSIQLSFQYQSSFLWVFCRQDLGQFLYKFNYNTTELVLSVKLNETPANISCTPCGLAMFHFLQSNKTAQLIMSATGTPFQDPFVYPRPLENLHITSISDQNVILQKHERKLFFSTIEITGTKQTTFKPAQNQTADSSNQTFEWHWIRSIYMMFNKFPCTDLMEKKQNLTRLWIVLSSDVSSLFLENIESEIERVQSELKKTNKPLDLMCIQVEQMQEVTPFLSDFLQQKPLIKKLLGSLIIKLITFIPKQIARSQSNELVLMNGGDPLSLKTVQNAIELAALINFGFYENVFKLWTGDVKVISSMGKQSTGKSFTLNHLTGLSFNISGARCTDGCWMSVKLTDTCLYVILDFEGLGSFERTDQDDMLLSLLNSAISSITLFKCEKRLERDVEKLFQNMNLGCNQLKGTEHLFRGFFMIVINDVDDSDIDETTREFEKKMKLILSKSQMNFLSTLYGSGYVIFPFPMFSTKSYYDETEELHSTVCSSVSPLFKNGEAFMSSLKLVMAKLTIGDFTPLGRQQIDERLSYLQSKFQFAVIFGQTCRKEPKTPDYRLKKIGDQKFEIQTEKMINLPAIGPIMIEDLETTFSEQFTAATVRRFIKILSLSHDNIKVWRTSLEEFTVECISFRFARVRRWLNENLKPWENSENPEIKDLIQSMFENWESWHFKYQQKYRFCDEKCAKCFLKCTHIVDHDANLEHECSSDHKCEETCAHCQTQSSKECGLKFGHEGQHNCMQIRHVCNETCKYNSLNGCEGKCQKEVDHIDFHQCSQKSHKCKNECSVKTCAGSCIVEADVPHSVHKCNRNNCDNNCSVDGCLNKCKAEDHFHGNSMGSRFTAEQHLPVINLFYTDHFCGKEHACIRNCQKEGFCHKVVEKAEEEATYQGKKSYFSYNLKFKEFGKKMQCRIKIPPFEKYHQGDHICSSNIHTCTVQCPTCDNYCNKPLEHQKNERDSLHDTSHGNMVRRYFLANQGEFEIGMHKYAVGESSIAEMCHIFCNELGRGHAHVVDCQKQKLDDTCHEVEGEKRHQTAKYKPDDLKEKDEMTHKAYWAFINFKDPSSITAQENFGKCPAYCSSEDHTESDRSYCILNLFHSPAKSIEECDLLSGSVKKGHVFTCSHIEKKYHFVLFLSCFVSIEEGVSKELINMVTYFANNRKELENGDLISIVPFFKNGTLLLANRIEVSEYNEDIFYQKGEKWDEQASDDKKAGLEQAVRLIAQKSDIGYVQTSLFLSDFLSEEHYDQMMTSFFQITGSDSSDIREVSILNEFRIASAKHPPSVGVSV